MGNKTKVASQVYIKLNGAEPPREVLQQVLVVTVDQHCHLPGMFAIRLHDRGLKLLDNGPFDLAVPVEIEAETKDGQRVPLIKGEITALEPEFGDGMIAELVVRGYDRLHRLYRETRSKAYLNKKDSDLAEEIARANQLQPQVDVTGAVYDHIYQHNQSDLAFLMQRAWRIGYECFVAEDTLYFRKPPTGSAGLTLTWGDDLLTYSPRMTLAEQVQEVVVKSWDPGKKEAILGRANKGGLYARVGEPKDGSAWAASFGNGRLVIVDEPAISQAEADRLAAARLDELSGAFLEAEGVAFRRPDVQAGQMVKIEGLGQRFSGTYLITRATHTCTPDGLVTSFCARGIRTGSLGDEICRSNPVDRWPGLVIGIVTNADDPKGWGRVKVKYPWLTDDAESDWARVVSAGGGAEAGLFATPGVGDEVAVAFAHGDFSQPLVLGGLWNGKDKVPPEGARAANGEKPLIREWRSRSGHRLVTYDNADKKLELVTAAGHRLVLDDAKGKITLKSKGGLTLTFDDNSSKVTLESSNEIEVKATGNLAVETKGNLSLKGAQISIEAQARASLKAPTVAIDGSGLTEIKGGLVKLN